MEKFKDFLEIINYLSTPILAILAYKGLEQIKVARETNKVNSRRDAFKVAAQQCNTFKDIVIPNAKKVSEEIKTKNLKLFDMYDVVVDGNSVKATPTQKIPDEEFDKFESLEHLTELINSLEGYSLYYTSGVAEDQVGYTTTGKTFCEIVKYYLPMLILEFEDNNYVNIRKLYFSWNKRIETEKLLLEKDNLEKKLKQNKTTNFNSIGT